MPPLRQDKTRVVTVDKQGNKKKEMSHTVTVTRTLTTTSSTAIIINSGYLKTFPGILKLLEVVLGAVALGIFCFCYGKYYHMVADTFFFCSITAVFFGTFCLFLSCIISFSTAAVVTKTIFEFIYHLFAFLLIGAASITLTLEIKDRNRGSYNYSEFFAAAIIGLVLTVLYFLSTVFSYRSYKSRI